MKRRQYLTTVGGIALTPTLSLARTNTSGHITPEQYKRQVPDSLAGFEVNHKEHDTESVGTHIYSLYSKRPPHPSIAYTEQPPDTEGRSQIIADVGMLRYGVDSVSEATRLLERFVDRVDYQMHREWSEDGNRYIYDVYTVEDWTLTVQNRLGTEYHCLTAIIDGERVEFDSDKERFRVVKQLIREKI